MRVRQNTIVDVGDSMSITRASAAALYARCTTYADSRTRGFAPAAVVSFAIVTGTGSFR